MGRPSERLQAAYDRRSQAKSILAAAQRGPLQTLTDRELALREHAVTIYPTALQRRARAWVRFGLESVRVEATLMRTTPLAAGIEFRAEDEVFRCWVWGNAITLDDVDGQA